MAKAGEDLLAAERDQVARRRRHQGTPADAPVLGLAISGGGIRSATLGLGILQSLSTHGVLGRVDYLSTVSGGSYIGSFLGSLFVPPTARGDADAVDAAVVREHVKTLGHDPLGSPMGLLAVRQLRQFGRYIAPRGAGDLIYGLGIVIRNWIALQLVIGVSLLAIWLSAIKAAVAMRAEFSPTELALLLPPLPFSPLWGLTAIALVWPAGAALAYFMSRRDYFPPPPLQYVKRVWWWVLMLVLALCVWRLVDPPPEMGGTVRLLLAGAAAAIAVALLVDAKVRQAQPPARSDWQSSAVAREDRIRANISRIQASGITLVSALAMAAAADTAALFLATWVTKAALLSGGVLAVAAMLARRFLSKVDVKKGLAIAKKRLGLVVNLAGILLGVLVILFWAAFAHLIAWDDDSLRTAVRLEELVTSPAILDRAVLITVGAALAVAFSPSFLNLSSLSIFYAGRLRRAYLGSSNIDRSDDRYAVGKDQKSDDIRLHCYYHESLAPVHLINVTLNETSGQGSNVVQRDRRGRNIALSPAGMLVSGDDPRNLSARPLDRAEVARFDCPVGEPLPLSAWVGISGAAVSTGLGSRSTVGLALLAGLSNARLGYWWRVERQGGFFAVFRNRPVQAYLLDELNARFVGDAGVRWNLSDGGHFENSGLYELIRRRLPLIIAADNGEDAEYQFADVANLVRKARIDFATGIRFLDAAELDGVLGAGTRIRQAFDGTAGFRADACCATALLARITYPDGGAGTLILLKPRVVADAPLDLIRYQAENAMFPHQSTGDQFFDESQWESYRRLGQLIADRLFAGTPEVPDLWHPAMLRPL
ncbi:hypothetical protein [Sandaracinobacteroides saxicola]|uniref:PNPLA domain-containing protein n=1 Tax=Sandaracinobacteroides saxicola TaxID=2759707 RepID=A0A7G5II28_9SPHN|nr:hypothetical protein [Sandaracinobacteroides saxicola]QMW23020.1 hypothetical protein H3309_00435 [Sandaracinobacteroides saxicola]